MIELTTPRLRRVCRRLEQEERMDVCAWVRGLLREATERGIERVCLYPGNLSYLAVLNAVAACDEEDQEVPA